MTKTTAIILAAGQGTRMKSPLPKVLHPVSGQPMIFRVLSQCLNAGFSQARVVLGHGGDLVKTVVQPFSQQVQSKIEVQIHHQKEQLGTADAVKAADIDTLEGTVVILNGDHPLINSDDLKSFVADFKELNLDLAVVSVELDEPGDFGRIVKHKGQFKAIIEAKEASPEILNVKEVNTGIYVCKAQVLKKYLPLIKNDNAKKEFYLTDIIGLSLNDGLKVQTIECKNTLVAHGVNNQSQLAQATQIAFKQKTEVLMKNGVIVINPDATYIEDSVVIGAGTIIYPGAFVKGKTAVGPFCVLEPNVFITDSILEDGVQVRAGSYLEQCVVKSQAKVGPYARLRPDTTIGTQAQVGNFVEMKKVNFGAKSKASHLTYLGDADIGEDVNIGCGTITCNYAADKKKYKTVIGDRVFVGSDSQLVAPVTVASDSIIASGSTITKDVPAGALAIARSRQENKDGLAAKFKKKDS